MLGAGLELQPLLVSSCTAPTGSPAAPHFRIWGSWRKRGPAPAPAAPVLDLVNVVQFILPNPLISWTCTMAGGTALCSAATTRPVCCLAAASGSCASAPPTLEP